MSLYGTCMKRLLYTGTNLKDLKPCVTYSFCNVGNDEMTKTTQIVGNDNDENDANCLRNKFKIGEFYFMRYLHGIKMSNELEQSNIIKVLENMGINLKSNEFRLLQVHAANTIMPVDDCALMIKNDKIRQVFKTNMNVYKKFFIVGYGYATTLIKNRYIYDKTTYVQVYNPAVHKFLPNREVRSSSFTGYVLAGGYQYIPEYIILTKLLIFLKYTRKLG